MTHSTSIAGHSQHCLLRPWSAGKTTLVDKLLTMTGAVKRPASVDDGTSICDFDEEEKHHKYSIEAQHRPFRPRRQAVQRDRHAGLSRLHRPDDRGACAASIRRRSSSTPTHGIEVNTRRVFQEAGKAGLGRIDRHQQDGHRQHRLPGLLDDIQEMFGNAVRAAQRADRPGARLQRRGQHAQAAGRRRAARCSIRPTSTSALIESIIEVDEEVIERYFEGKLPTDEEIARLIVEAVAAGHVDSDRLRLRQDRASA